jgi:hypothetical protein
MMFQKQQLHCPQCGKSAQGTQETIPGIALFGEPSRQGQLVEVDYGGETEIDWNGQRTVKNAAHQVALVCADGHCWWASVEQGKT